ncbi:hypothetical protein [Psychrobacter sp. NPDC078501]|uniref:hypothetical protein n=1 Tax=Psychrobacter sp. NPDC078501 TaxID=3364495 RepID=UPI00384FB47D
MNYQHFYDMNILVSDPMVRAIQENQLSLIIFALFTFYLLMFLHYFIFSVIARFILIRRHRRVASSNSNVKALL